MSRSIPGGRAGAAGRVEAEGAERERSLTVAVGPGALRNGGGGAVDPSEVVRALERLAAAFVPLFVAMDVVGVLPLILAWTSGLPPEKVRRTLDAAVLTALGLGLSFMVLGRAVFALLGITVADFLVAGGLVLLALAVLDVVAPRGSERGVEGGGDVGIVPIGTPLLVGPATLTTLLLLQQREGVPVTVGAFVLNLAIAWYLFRRAAGWVATLGTGGLRAVSKVASLLLAAIAVRMIREGVGMPLGV
ncbi:MAG TPA: MarC family protein [Chloroflexota bacterium]